MLNPDASRPPPPERPISGWISALPDPEMTGAIISAGNHIRGGGAVGGTVPVSAARGFAAPSSLRRHGGAPPPFDIVCMPNSPAPMQAQIRAASVFDA